MSVNLFNNLEKVYLNYGECPKEQHWLNHLKIQIWNAVKHIFLQSDWQIARNQIVGILKNNYFPGIVYKGLRIDTFSDTELSDIADKFLTKLVGKHKNGETKQKTNIYSNIMNADDKIMRMAGRLIFKKIEEHPELLPGLDMTREDFTKLTRKKQKQKIYDNAALGHGFNEFFSKLAE